MKKFKVDEKNWYCGFWNSSPLEIGLFRGFSRKELYAREKLHFHKDFREYYLIIDGKMTLIINKKELLLKKYDLLMVEPGEIHRVTSLGPNGCSYVVIKEKSYENGTMPVKI